MIKDYLVKNIIENRNNYNFVEDDNEHFLVDSGMGFCIQGTDIKVILKESDENVFKVIMIENDKKREIGCIYQMDEERWSTLYLNSNQVHLSTPSVYETIVSDSKLTVIETILNNCGIV